MGNLAKKWEAAADDLGIEIVAPYSVQVDNNVTIRADLLVRNFGARNGMLVVTDYGTVKSYVQQLVKLGYGFSVLEEPAEGESYDRETLIHMLSDWSWSGPEDRKPGWIVNVAE